jgi:hypothetical protein
MIRISISQAMAAIALVAGHLAALRAFAHGAELPSLLAGLLPLADAHGAALYLVARGDRTRRAGRRYGIIAFAAFTGLSLMVLLIASAVATDGVLDWVVTALDPVGEWLMTRGYGLRDLESPLFEWFVIPFLVGAVLSGPPLVLGSATGWLASRLGSLKGCTRSPERGVRT